MSKLVPPHYPVEKELPIATLDKPLIIECAFPGWISLSVNPNIPFRTPDVAKEIVDSINEGASVIHVHPRDPEDGAPRVDPALLKETLDMVFQECPDVVTWNHSWRGERLQPIDYREHTAMLLGYRGGIKYIQGSVVLIKGNPMELNMPLDGSEDSIREGVVFLEEHGVKPIFQIYDTFGIQWLKREIIDEGIAKSKPYICNLHMGKHHSLYVGQDPWGFLQLFTSINMLKATIPDCVVGVFAGGRNWLPITTAAIMLGADVVRTGVEDAYWVYPHRSEIITKNSDVVAKVARIATELGRKIATPEMVRKICGMA